jgi:hypothetical protein
MRGFSAAVLATVAGLALSGPGLRAQQPGPLHPPPEVARLPQSVGPAPWFRVPAQAPPAGVLCQPNGKVCVPELKHNTKFVFACKCEDYCLPHCSLLSLLWEGCACEGDCCGAPRVRHRLVIRKVDAGDTKTCVVREVPPGCETRPAARVPCPAQGTYPVRP